MSGNTPDKISVRQPNAITNARYNYTKIEKNVIYHAIVALQNQADAVTPDIFGKHLEIRIPYARLKAWDMNNNMCRDLKKAVRDLRKKDYYIVTEDGWIDTGFITYAEYSDKNGLYLEVSKALVPALLDYAKGFTAYNATIAMCLQSKYSQRFYEWCCQWRNTGWFEFTPEKLNDVLDTRMTTGALKDRVLAPAMAELDILFKENKSDVRFDVEEERGGKGRGGGVKKWRFKVQTKDIAKTMIADIDSDDYLYVMDVLKKAFGRNHDLINAASEQILTSKCVKSVADRFSNIKTAKVQNLGGYVRNILTQEFALAV